MFVASITKAATPWRSLLFISLTSLAILLAACGPEASAPEGTAAAQPAAEEPAHPGLVTIRAEDYSFTAPPTFPSGWVRLRFENQGAEPHFLIIWDLPDGKTFDDYFSEVSSLFSKKYAQYRSGELDQGAFFEQLIGAIPEWFYGARMMGGPGFTAAGHTSETLIYLEPGDNYVMECFVRSMTEPHTFHGDHGMLRPLIVTERRSALEPPQADVEITLSNFKLGVEGDLSAGPHTAKITVLETPEGFTQHNVHLAKLNDGQTGAEVAPWLSWVDAMLPPAPATFLGGAGQTGGGRASYFSFELEPGRYAWVSEDFGAREGMVAEFEVK